MKSLLSLSAAGVLFLACGSDSDDPLPPQPPAAGSSGAAGESAGSGGSCDTECAAGEAGSAGFAGLPDGAGGGAAVGSGGGAGEPEASAGSEAGGSANAGSCAFDVSASFSPAIQTVGIVEWSTNVADLEHARIEYGLDESYGLTAPVEIGEAPSFRTLLLGMKPERTYHFRIVAGGGRQQCQSDDFTLDTGYLQSGLPALTARSYSDERSSRGFLVSSFLTAGYAYILDADGDYVWAHASGDETSRAQLSHDGKYVWYSGINVGGGKPSMKRVSLDGLTEEDFTGEFGEIHHDFTVLPDETIAFIQHDGNFDRIVERAPDGETTEIFHLSELKDAATNHANSIHYSEDDDTYTVSDLNQSVYINVTRNGELRWVLGGANGDFTGDGASWEGGQHGHHFLSPDRLLVFNNGEIGGISAAFEVALDFEALTATRVWEYRADVRTIFFGDVVRMQNGNTVVSFSASGVVHEVDPEGELLHELRWDLGGASGYMTLRESLYGAPQN